MAKQPRYPERPRPTSGGRHLLHGSAGVLPMDEPRIPGRFGWTWQIPSEDMWEYASETALPETLPRPTLLWGMSLTRTGAIALNRIVAQPRQSESSREEILQTAARTWQEMFGSLRLPRIDSLVFCDAPRRVIRQQPQLNCCRACHALAWCIQVPPGLRILDFDGIGANKHGIQNAKSKTKKSSSTGRQPKKK